MITKKNKNKKKQQQKVVESSRKHTQFEEREEKWVQYKQQSGYCRIYYLVDWINCRESIQDLVQNLEEERRKKKKLNFMKKNKKRFHEEEMSYRRKGRKKMGGWGFWCFEDSSSYLLPSSFSPSIEGPYNDTDCPQQKQRHEDVGQGSV